MHISNPTTAFLLGLATVTVATLPAPVDAQQSSVNGCTCPEGPTWAVAGDCFCGPEAQKIETCVKGQAPNWPLEVQDAANANKDCPSPVSDPQGFQKCIQDQTPKALPNADKIPADCVKSTNAVSSERTTNPGNASSNGGNSVTNGGNGGSGTVTGTPSPKPTSSSVRGVVASAGVALVAVFVGMLGS
ncbi:hypothetical protein HK102_003003 [Quaeritorhiza haematococci]|nr:hypothetical protein HK102_003003 [Quaeritorhiza haematococci]